MQAIDKVFSPCRLCPVLLLSLTLVGVASADVVQGKDWLHAEGAGVAVLRMSGDIEINGHGIGVVYIYGADEIQATGRGERYDRPGGGVFFRSTNPSIVACVTHLDSIIIGYGTD